MQTVVKATLGRQTGSRASRRLRAEGRLPGVVYGLDKDPQTVAVDYVELRSALSASTGMNTVFTLDVEGATETVLVRSVQRDPIRRLVTHADFLRVDPDRKVRVKVPIELVGDASAVTEAGGLIEQKMFALEIEVAPNAIPEVFEADISIMTLDRRIAVTDLRLPEGVVAMVEDDLSVVAPVMTRSAKADAREEGEDEFGDEDGEASADGDEDSDGASGDDGE